MDDMIEVAVAGDLKRKLIAAGLLHDDRFRDLGEVRTWEDFRQNLLHAIENEKSLMGIMLSLVMVVAGFTVFAILSMMVTEKRRWLSVLRRLREIFRCSGNNTVRGSGDHHRIGWLSLYQGKIPRR